MNRGNRNKKKKSKVLLTFVLTFVIAVGIFAVLGFQLLNKMNSVDIPTSNEELGIKEEVAENENTNMVNIALFGIDRRNPSERGRSDSIMIATLDRQHKKIKLTSLLRDTYVEIPGRGMDKLGHAYAYGGSALAIKTINHNFNMNIREFATVDFTGLEKIIDILGGVEINVDPSEVRHVSGSVAGTQVLNGKQTLAYSRIRKVGTDYQRTERQRIILEKVINKGIRAGVTKYPQLLNAILPNVDTSLSKTEILSLGTSALTRGIKDIDQYRIPVDGHVKSQMINGMSVEMPSTLEDNINFLHNFIYEDVKN